MTDQPIAVALKDAPAYVPFSKDYLYRAVKRTGDNPLPARLAGGKYVIAMKDLEAWVQREGVAA